MVANHSHKAKARELMALSNGKLSYTEALGLAANLQVRLTLGHIDSCYTVEEATALGLNWEHLKDNFSEVMANADLKLAEIAADGLSPERDLVIFGKAGTGKSVALDAVLAATGLTAKILQSYYQHYGELLKGPNAERGEAEILVIDEVQRLNGSEASSIAAQLQTEKRRIIVIHANSEHGVSEKIERIYPGVELRDPLYLEATRNDYGIRGLRLLDPSVLSRAKAAMIDRPLVETAKNMGVTQTVFETASESAGSINNVLTASEAIQEGRDIIVFGVTGSGKSTLADSIIELSNLRTLILTEGVQRYARRASSAVVLDRETLESVGYGQLLRVRSELIVVDELRRGSEGIELLLEHIPSRLIVVHAATPKIALGRIANSLPSTALRKPLLIEATIEREQPARTSRLIDPS